MVQDMALVRRWARRYYEAGLNPSSAVIDSFGFDWSWAFVVFRDVPDFPGYKVGSDASVWGCWTHGGRMSSLWSRLNPRPDKDGYLRVLLRKNRKRYCLGVHYIVLLSFRDPRPPGCVVRHFPDPSPLNNRPWNLSWSTQRENLADRKIHGTHPSGERHPRSKLSALQVKEIRSRKSLGESLGVIALDYGVSYHTIWDITSGRSWI